MHQATRIEIADALHEAFADGPETRDQLVAHAEAAGARPQVRTELERLPDRAFEGLRDLWGLLPGVPIELDPTTSTADANP